MTAPRQPRPVVDLASPPDDAALRHVLSATPMEGVMRLASERAPSFFDALRVEGTEHTVLVARTGSGVIGFGAGSVKPCYLDGRPASVGYLGSLRLLPAYRGGVLVSRGYRLFRERAVEGGPPVWLSTILLSNRKALAQLAAGRGGLPYYRDLGRFVCGVVRPGRHGNLPDTPGIAYRRARADDVPALVDFLRREGARRQFFPVYHPRDFGEPGGLLRGLAPANVLLAERDGRIAGCLGCWDQRHYRQYRVAGYAPWLRAARPLLNAVMRGWRRPSFPAPGSILRLATLAVCCIEHDDLKVWRNLAARQLQAARDRFDFVAAGFHERDPLCAAFDRLPRIDTTSRLFSVEWQDWKPGAFDHRPPYLETGAL